jgi:small subunit ribosomal protein S18
LSEQERGPEEPDESAPPPPPAPAAAPEQPEATPPQAERPAEAAPPRAERPAPEGRTESGPGGDRGDRGDRGDDRGERGGDRRRRHFGRRKVCTFCVEKVDRVDYKDPMRLRRFLSDRARIEPRRKTGTCAKHQRWLAVALKRARHLALLPYSPEHIRASGMFAGRR